MMKKVLILSHQGAGLIEKLVASVKELEFDYHILSSNVANLEDALTRWETPAQQVTVVEESDLNWDNCASLLAELNCDFSISIWEGYRLLMAQINQHLGCDDISPAAIELIQDKSKLRALMQEKRLSQVERFTVEQALAFPKEVFENNKHVAKPRRGIGSLSVSILNSYQDLLDAIDEFNRMSEYPLYKSYHQDNELFIEQYIDGKEFSFEMLVANSEVKLFQEHEKLVVTETEDTVLENVFLSPSIMLSRIEIEKAKTLLEKTLKLVGAHTGCFHIEMKYTSRLQWELIEINPRVGGMFVPESVNLISDKCLILSWLQILAGIEIETAQPAEDTYAYFEIEYADNGKKIADYQQNTSYPTPDEERIYLPVGSTAEGEKMAIFACQYFWQANKAKLDKILSSAANKKFIEIKYTEAEPA